MGVGGQQRELLTLTASGVTDGAVVAVVGGRTSPVAGVGVGVEACSADIPEHRVDTAGEGR